MRTRPPAVVEFIDRDYLYKSKENQNTLDWHRHQIVAEHSSPPQTEQGLHPIVRVESSML